MAYAVNGKYYETEHDFHREAYGWDKADEETPETNTLGPKQRIEMQRDREELPKEPDAEPHDMWKGFNTEEAEDTQANTWEQYAMLRKLPGVSMSDTRPGKTGEGGGGLGTLVNPANSNVPTAQRPYDPNLSSPIKGERLENQQKGIAEGALDKTGQIKTTPYDDAVLNQQWKSLQTAPWNKAQPGAGLEDKRTMKMFDQTDKAVENRVTHRTPYQNLSPEDQAKFRERITDPDLRKQFGIPEGDGKVIPFKGGGSNFIESQDGGGGEGGGGGGGDSGDTFNDRWAPMHEERLKSLSFVQKGMLGVMKAAEATGMMTGPNLKLYNDIVGRGRTDPVTEKDFEEKDLSYIRKLVDSKGKSEGKIDYKDYDNFPDDEEPTATRGKPSNVIRTSLGGFRYKKDKEGNIEIEDKYDFNVAKGDPSDDNISLQFLHMIFGQTYAAAIAGRKVVPDDSGLGVPVKIKIPKKDK